MMAEGENLELDSPGKGTVALGTGEFCMSEHRVGLAGLPCFPGSLYLEKRANGKMKDSVMPIH